jgi:hypothetical protein
MLDRTDAGTIDASAAAVSIAAVLALLSVSPSDRTSADEPVDG